MAMQKGKPGILGKVSGKLKGSFDKHKDDEVKYGNMELPAGIENGIAQLVDCKFDVVAAGKQNAGSVYFYAAGVIVSPEEHEGTPIKGLRTSITEPLYDTPTRTRQSGEDHLLWIMNELKKLGADLSSATIDDLEGIAAALQEDKPFFRFRTWKGPKNTEGPYKDREPRTQHQWNGVVSDFDPGAVDPAAGVGSGEAPGGPGDEVGGGDQGGDAGGGDDFDVDAVLAEANANKKPAQKALSAKALELGIDQQTIDDAADWNAIGDMVREAMASGGGGDDDGGDAGTQAPEFPYVGAVCTYQPTDPKTKAPQVNARTKKPVLVECEVTAIGPGGKLSLKNLDDGRTTYDKVDPAKVTEVKTS